MTRRSCTLLCLVAIMATLVVPVATNAEQIKLQLFTWAAEANIKPIVDLFEKSHPNIKVELLLQPDGYFDKLQTLMAGGIIPDVFQLSYQNIPEYATLGALYDLTKATANDKEFQARKRDYPPFLLDGYTYKNKFYGLAFAFNPQLLYFNKNMFDAAGAAYPTTALSWDDFARLAKKLTKRNGTDTTQWGYSWNGRWMEFVWQNGGDIIDSTGTKSVFNTPQTVGALQYIQDLMYKHEVAPSPNLNLNAENLFLGGQVAMHHQGGWRLRFYNDTAMQGTSLNFDWGVGKLPKSVNEATVALFDGYVASSATKHPNEAWELVKFIAGPEGQEVVARGNYLTIPVLRSVANNLIPSGQPIAEMLRARLAQTEVARLEPVVVKQSQLPQTYGAELDQVFRNQLAPANAAEAIHAKLNTFLSGK